MTHIAIQKWSCNRCGRSQEKETSESDWVPDGWKTLYLGHPNEEARIALVADLCPTCHRDARNFAAGAQLVEPEMT